MKFIRGQPIYKRLFLDNGIPFTVGALLGCAFLISLLFLIIFSPTASAVQTVPYKVNFQGALSSSSGTPLTDGQYNMTFRLYDASTGGSAVWIEVREAVNRVTVTNGRFSVQLGDVSALSPSLFTTQPLYFEIELPAPATATCDTASCASYTEGPMTPRQSLGSSPYAMNADLLDGYEASDFIIGSTNNTFTGSNQFKNATDSTSALGVRAADNTSLLNVDTTNAVVTVGTTLRYTDGENFGLTFAGPADYQASGELNTSRHLTGATAGTVSSMSVYMHDLDDAPFNKYKMGIYSGDSAAPLTLIASSNEGTLVAGWNTIEITAMLNPNSYYWLGYITNGRVDTNNPGIIDGGQSYQPDFSDYENGFPSTPPVQGSGAYYDETLSIYTTYSVGSTLNPAFTVDSQNKIVQIGSSTASASVVVFVLDNKSSASDPTGVNGAMYYNASLNKFRCYEASVWRNCLEGAALSSSLTYNEFLTVSDGDAGALFTNAGAGSGVTAVAGVANHPGIISANTGTTTTGVAGWSLGVGNALVLGGGTKWSYESIVRMPILSANPQVYTIQSGYVNTTTATPADGCFLQYSNSINGGDFEAVCRSSGTSSECDTLLAPMAGQWYKLKTVVNATRTSADFYIDGVLECTITSNITSAAVSPMVLIRKTSNTTARTLEIDYVSNTGDQIVR